MLFNAEVIHLSGQRVAGRQVTLFGLPAVRSADGLRVLGTTTTDAHGRCVIERPEGPFERAFAHVAVGGGTRVEIPLEADGRFPATAIVALDLDPGREEIPAARHTSGCAPCDSHHPADGGGTDVGTGCIDFTQPDRVLEEYSYQFVVRSTDPAVRSARTPVLERHSIDWQASPAASQARSVSHGHVLTIKQRWVSDGYSLGTLLYSLPLAPGQKKQIAIVDWERREAAVREEVVAESAELESMLVQDRDVNEIVRANLDEAMQAHSESFDLGFGGGHGSSGGGGVSVLGVLSGGLVDAFAGALGYSSSSASYEASRDLSSSALQTIRERTSQAAASLRGRRSTVVHSATSGERSVARSESVANYNHCHALTIQYFEVLRHLLVRQELADAQECLFVPLEMAPFDARKALQWREPLQRHSRDQRVIGGFVALDRLQGGHWESYGLTAHNEIADLAMTSLRGTLRLRFQFVAPALAGADTAAVTFDPVIWNWYGSGWTRSLGMNARQMFDRLRGKAVPFDVEFHRVAAPALARTLADQLEIRVPGFGRLPLDFTLMSAYRHGEALDVEVRLSGPMPALTRRAVRALEIVPVAASRLPADSKILVESCEIQYRNALGDGWLVRAPDLRDDLTSTDGVYFDTSQLSAEERRSPYRDDASASRRLLDHLNDQIEYYHKVIWTTMSPDRRYMMLDGFVAPNSEGRSIASVVDNRIIGIVGNSLVMPVARGIVLDPARDRQESLIERYQPTTPDVPLRVALPTKGVHAEAVMGNCNSCERIDGERFWRWEESPIPDSPASIEPVSTVSRHSEPVNLAPSGLSAPLINVQNAPAAPAPAALAQAFALLGNPNVFRNITGLAGNQRNALEAMKASLAAANRFGAEAADVAKSFGRNATNLALQESTGGDIERITRAITSARESGLIDDERAGELTRSALSAMVGRGIDEGGAGDSRTTRDRLDTIRDAVEDGTLDEDAAGGLAERALGRMVEDGDSPDDTPSRAVESLLPHAPGASIEARDGDREVVVRPPGEAASYDFTVSGRIDQVHQPTSRVCWAAAAATMLTWQRSVAVSSREAARAGGMAPDGTRYIEKFDSNISLIEAHQEHFFRTLGMELHPPQSLDAPGYRHLLERFGPLWIQNDETPSDPESTHFRVIYGIASDGAVESTFLRIMDPATGPVLERFDRFVAKYERLAIEADRYDLALLIQLVHFP